MAGEQLVEQQPERVDVGGRRHRLAAHLLRARVVGVIARRQRGQRGIALAAVEELRDAEVEQLRVRRRA